MWFLQHCMASCVTKDPQHCSLLWQVSHGSWIDTQSQSIVGKTHDACLGSGSWWGIISASTFVSPRNMYPGQLVVRTGYDAFVLNQVKHCCPWYPQLCTVLAAPSPQDLTGVAAIKRAKHHLNIAWMLARTWSNLNSDLVGGSLTLSNCRAYDPDIVLIFTGKQWKSCPHKDFHMGLPWWLGGKQSTCQWRRHGFHLWFGNPICLQATKPAYHTIECFL